MCRNFMAVAQLVAGTEGDMTMEANNLLLRFKTRTECAQLFVETFPVGFNREKQRAKESMLVW